MPTVGRWGATTSQVLPRRPRAGAATVPSPRERGDGAPPGPAVGGRLTTPGSSRGAGLAAPWAAIRARVCPVRRARFGFAPGGAVGFSGAEYDRVGAVTRVGDIRRPGTAVVRTVGIARMGSWARF